MSRLSFQHGRGLARAQSGSGSRCGGRERWFDPAVRQSCSSFRTRRGPSLRTAPSEAEQTECRAHRHRIKFRSKERPLTCDPTPPEVLSSSRHSNLPKEPLVTTVSKIRMDIPLHYFDEYIGDRLYAALDNPFAHYAADSGLTNLKNVSSLAAAIDLSSTSAAVDSVARLVGSVPGLSSLGRDSIVRQALSLYGITYVGIFLLYFSVATFSYYTIFDHRMEQHPRFLKNQVRKEIAFSLEAFPMLDLLTLPWFVGDVRGWSMLYDTVEEGPFGKQGGALPWLYMAFSAAFFLWFTDFCIYWVHRWLHIPFLYKRLHKPHHKWISESSRSSTRRIREVDQFLLPVLAQSRRRSPRTRSTRSTATSSRCRTTWRATCSRFTSTCSSDSSRSSTSGQSL